MKTYKVGAFKIKSAIHLPCYECQTQEVDLSIDVKYRPNPTVMEKHKWCEIAAFTRELGVCRRLYYDGNKYMLSIGSNDYIFYPAKSRIVCYNDDPTQIKWISQQILGAVLGFYLNSSGMITLHASSVVMEEYAVCFLGGEGAGKSTLVAFLQKNGYLLFADDLFCLNQTSNDLKAIPTAYGSKLDTKSLSFLNLDNKTQDDEVVIQPQLLGSACYYGELNQIMGFEVEAVGSESVPQIVDLDINEKIKVLLKHQFAGWLIPLSARRNRLKEIVKLAHNLQLKRLLIPRNFDSLKVVMNLLSGRPNLT